MLLLSIAGILAGNHQLVVEAGPAVGALPSGLLGLRPSAEQEDQTYGVIVDCGSSGTRAHIYQWDSILEYPELLHDIGPSRGAKGEPLSLKIRPGLSSLADNPASSSDYIKPILDFIIEHIPESRHPYTGIYILATAGMRLLDEQTQKDIMTDIANYVKENYRFARVRTSVISGADEGMYQWISVNSKARRFLEKETDSKTKTFAVIEMGGASAQVTYQLRRGMEGVQATQLPASALEDYYDQTVEPAISRSNLIEHTYRLHSTTFLGFGSASAREAYLDLLIKEHQKFHSLLAWPTKLFKSCFGLSGMDDEIADTVDDPCMPVGYLSDRMKKPKAMFAVRNKTIGFIADEDDNEKNFFYKLRGRGNYAKCKRLVERMLKLAKKEGLNCKPHESCTMSLIGTKFVPFKRYDFVAIGDIFHTTNIMLRSSGVYDHNKIVTKTKTICETPYNELQQKYPNLQDQSRYYLECFKAVWVDTFLVKALRMPEDFEMLKTINSIGGDELDWTLGAVLDKSLAIERATEIGQGIGDSDDTASLYSL